MNEQIKREEAVHGAMWNAVHAGYFSDPAVAAPLVAKVRECADQIRPDTLVDLGGGTGFLLSELRAGGAGADMTLLDLDDSVSQLEAAKAKGLSCVRGSVATFTRHDLGIESRRCLFMMRSVLHYFGLDGLRPALRHLRAQCRPGERFIHQSASFDQPRDADCMTELYRLMRSPKGYPTVDRMRRELQAEGWAVLEVIPAAPLPLRDQDLASRYQLDSNDLRAIRERLPRDPGVSENVFRKTDDGFEAFLHYRIYVCAPATA